MSLKDDIRRAVEKAADGAVEHLETVPIIETFRGQTVWEGVVEVFAVASPPPDKAYGWAIDHPDGPRFVAVLGTPPVNTALSAVRAWLSSQGN